jgi:hypothetical protein
MKEFLEYREIAQIRRACHALKRSEGRLEVVVEMITRHNAWRGGE